MSDFPLEDSVDHEILMHRDVHFGGSFLIMLTHYQEESKASYSPFDIEQIEALKELEESLGQNLSQAVLSESEKLEVNKFIQLYQSFETLFENKEAPPFRKAIAELILSDDFDEEEEIEKVVACGPIAVNGLIQIVSSELFYNPLAPGYGQAPLYAAKALGALKDPEAISALFEAMDFIEHDFEPEFVAALCEIGDSAKAFLLKIFSGVCHTKDTEKALVVLLNFPDDEVLGTPCLNALLSGKFTDKFPYILYLVLGCSGLKDEKSRSLFLEYFKKSDLPLSVKEEMSFVIKRWRNNLVV